MLVEEAQLIEEVTEEIILTQIIEEAIGVEDEVAINKTISSIHHKVTRSLLHIMEEPLIRSLSLISSNLINNTTNLQTLKTSNQPRVKLKNWRNKQPNTPSSK